MSVEYHIASLQNQLAASLANYAHRAAEIRAACCSQAAACKRLAAALFALLFFSMNGTCHAANSATLPSGEQCNALPNMQAAECLSAVANSLQPVLQRYYEATRAAIRKLASGEQGIIAQDLQDALGSLQHAQASWKAYRDSHCDMVAELFTNGSGKAVGEAACVINLTRLRIHELWEFGRYPGLPEPK